MIDTQAYNYVIAQAVFIVGIVQVLFKCILFPVKINQSPAIGANPDITGFIFNKPVDIIVWKALCIRFLVTVMREKYYVAI